MLEALDAHAVRRWSVAALASLDAHRAEIDRLNVFPVADRDTGTNLALTLRSAADALAGDDTPGAGAALSAYARGAVLGARGNSGVIMSQLLRAIADAAADAMVCTAAMLREGLVRGAVQAREAVADPVEGTILTVAGAVAGAIARTPTTLAELARVAVAAAGEALRHTPEQLPDLARAGVVDAGGRGLVLVLRALAGVIDATLAGDDVPAAPQSAVAAAPVADGGPAFEVQYLLDANVDAITGLRARLGALGDSVAVVGTGADVWNVHAHVDDVGAAIEAGVEAGRPHSIAVTRFADSIDPAGSRNGSSAVVALARGAALGALFGAEGLSVVTASPGAPLSAGFVLESIRSAGAHEVALLPNDEELTTVAEAAAVRARRDGVRVTVVPTRSPVQGLAAVAVHDPARRFDDDVVAMAEAAAATRYAEITVADRDALTSVGACRAGDTLGLIDGDVVEIGSDVAAVARGLVDRLTGIGAELLTVLVGSGAPDGLGAAVTAHARERAPLTEVTVYACDHPTSPLIIGAE